jgi:hypothetical protein
LKEVFMDNEANQVINGYRGGTTQRNLADEFDDADDHM